MQCNAFLRSVIIRTKLFRALALSLSISLSLSLSLSLSPLQKMMGRSSAEAEEEEEEESAPRDNPEVRYDVDLPGTHSYLGNDLEVG